MRAHDNVVDVAIIGVPDRDLGERPAVALVRNVEPRPDRAVTVFAGQDLEATARLREHMVGIPPSSPFMALFKDGDPVFVLERRHIEGRSASAIPRRSVRAIPAPERSRSGATTTTRSPVD